MKSSQTKPKTSSVRPRRKTQPSSAGALVRGRAAFERKAWRTAHDELVAASREGSIPAADLERLAMASHLMGNDAESDEYLAHAHAAFASSGDGTGAARAAFWLGFQLYMRGETARGSGWLARARRSVEREPSSVIHGYLHLADGIALVRGGSPSDGIECFARALETGELHCDRDLVTLARHGRGRALIALGRTAEGIALLDEVMIAVTAGELIDAAIGPLYCSVISVCHDAFDLGRAQEWTMALARWCDSQPELVPYRGVCLVHRAEIMQLRGDWYSALRETGRACELLAAPPPDLPARAAAHYRKGELHRLRGEWDDAEGEYAVASAAGISPQPGLALLRLAQGRVAAAAASIRAAMDGRSRSRTRTAVLAACVEIMIANGDIITARLATDELHDMAARSDARYLHALAAMSRGSVLLAEGDAQAALGALRDACTSWRALAMPYETACARFLLARAHTALDDHDTAAMELASARTELQRLGATEARAVNPAPREARGGLTAREVEVIRLVAQGKTNASIARTLGISEKTVARHTSNIFAKLGLSSRAAATAFAYEQGIVRRRG